jgi:ABC-type enterochelin transport system permease subunit
MGPKFVGPLLWLGLCVALLALWLRLADSAMHGLVWGAIYITVVALLGVQIVLALAAVAGHVFA